MSTIAQLLGRLRRNAAQNTKVTEYVIKEMWKGDPVLRGLDPEKYVAAIPCKHCGLKKRDHAKGKCSFDSTFYEPHPSYI